jgi:hypothetical protein
MEAQYTPHNIETFEKQKNHAKKKERVLTSDFTVVAAAPARL